MRLPGVCIVCHRPVLWNGRFWKDPARGMGRQHVCSEDRPLCNGWMVQAKERCARSPGHRGYHRTRWAMDNELASKTGRGLASRLGSAQDARVEASGTQQMTRPGSRLPRLSRAESPQREASA